MPWAADAAHCGFSSVEPWLPLGADHPAMSVDVEEGDPQSMLTLTRKLLATRNENDALQLGDLEIVEAHGDLLVFERRSPQQHLICAFNMGSDDIAWQPAQPDRWRVIAAVNETTSSGLPAYGAKIMEKIA